MTFINAVSASIKNNFTFIVDQWSQNIIYVITNWQIDQHSLFTV